MTEPASEDPQYSLVLRGRAIAEDDAGRICLDDLWAAAEGKPSQKPAHWKIGQAARGLIAAVVEKIRISDVLPTSQDVICASRGRGNKGTYAHPIVAAAYAGYLSPELEVEVRQVWLRFRAGDATLADEILQRASAEANHWAGVRALSRAKRNQFTDTLKAHGVVEKGYMACTEATYTHLLGAPSYKLRAERQLKPGNLRDQFDSSTLAFIMATESLAVERIEEEERDGNVDCVHATALAAMAIRNAVEADRASRQKRIPK